MGSTSFLPHKLFERKLVLIALELPIVAAGDAHSVLVGFAWCKMVAELFASPSIGLFNIFWILGFWSSFLLGLHQFLQPLRESFGHDIGHKVGVRQRLRDSARRRVHLYHFVEVFESTTNYRVRKVLVSDLLDSIYGSPRRD